MTRNISQNISRAKRLGLWLLLVGILLGPGFAEPKTLKEGDPFPDLSGFGLEGAMPTELKGKVILLDFWASWCGPCKESFPVLEELHKKYAASGLVVLGVNVDDKAKAADDFLKRRPVSFPIVRDVSKRLVSAVDIETMPTSFLIDRQGKIKGVHKGFRGAETKRAYVKEIEELLK